MKIVIDGATLASLYHLLNRRHHMYVYLQQFSFFVRDQYLSVTLQKLKDQLHEQ